MDIRRRSFRKRIRSIRQIKLPELPSDPQHDSSIRTVLTETSPASQPPFPRVSCISPRDHQQNQKARCTMIASSKTKNFRSTAKRQGWYARYHQGQMRSLVRSFRELGCGASIRSALSAAKSVVVEEKREVDDVIRLNDPFKYQSLPRQRCVNHLLLWTPRGYYCSVLSSSRFPIHRCTR